MSDLKVKHTFAICAYKESKYLEECIISLEKQKMKSEIIMVTSTPNEYIKNIANKHEIPLFVNDGEKGITQDWNFAYKMSKTELVTIAHQDDVYLPEYSKIIVNKINKEPDTLIAFTDYAELREGKPVLKSTLLKIKRVLLLPLKIPVLQKSIFVRRRILSLGNAICCPAVTYVKENLPKKVFKSGFRSNEDWEAWEMLSRRRGSFVYVSQIGMYHRIHGESETSIIIGDNERTKEDYVMFCKFWPKRIARMLANIYAKSEKSNQL